MGKFLGLSPRTLWGYCTTDQTRNPVTELVSSYCPYCAEPVELTIDESGGSRQSYVEDCPVCCRPWEVTVSVDSEGNPRAMLRTGDE